MWTIPLGLPVLPEVYSMKRWSSLSSGSGGQVVDSLDIAYYNNTHTVTIRIQHSFLDNLTSCSCTSLPDFMLTLPPVLLATYTLFTVSSNPSMALSTISFSGNTLPPLIPWSEVITMLADAEKKKKIDKNKNTTRTWLGLNQQPFG